MDASELTCPNCGAPVKLEGKSGPTVRCPYCESEIVLPEELRPPAAPVFQVVTLASAAQPARTPPVVEKPKRWTPGATLMLAIFVIIMGGVAPTIISRRQQAALAAQLKVEMTATARAVYFAQTAAVTATPPPTPAPTAQFAESALAFGGQGAGPGLFTRASFVAVDGERTLYAAEYEGGQVQRFNLNGDYLSLWRFAGSETILHGLAASFDGDVYLAYDQVIDRVDGSTGKLIQRLTHPEGGEFGDLAVGADGRLYAVWYEGRWGFITSLEGHREELVVFSPEGEALAATPNFISAQTDALALDVDIAVDGSGAVSALSDSVLFQFSPEGRFLDRVDHTGDGVGQFGSAHALALDGQGRVYVVSGDLVYVYAGGQKFIDVFASPDFLNALCVDFEGALWGAADERLFRFELQRE